jgi:hypothetical protein
MKRILILLLALIVSPLYAMNKVPAGWNQFIDASKDAIVFMPKDQNVDITVKYYPSEFRDGNSVINWLRNKLSKSKAPQGEWVGEIESLTRYSINHCYGKRKFRKPDGSIGVLQAAAFSADNIYIRFGISIHSENRVSDTYLKEGANLLLDINDVEIANAQEERRIVELETPAFKVEGIKTGGIIKPGLYVGTETVDGKKSSKNYYYELMLYDSGEYEFLTGNKSFGYYAYSKFFGKLYIEKPCINYWETSKKNYCIYGINEKSGKPVIYAYNSPKRLLLNWVKPADRLSPSQRERLEEKKNRNKSRYQYVTNPGDGLSLDQIETILYVYEEEGRHEISAVEEKIYLLTKDGRVMDGVPVAPNVLDVTKSQNMEPDRWGWWKLEGERYSFAWNADRKRYAFPKGKQLKTKPIPAKTRLKGDWGASVIYKGSDFTSGDTWGEVLNKEGRFVNYAKKILRANGSDLSKNYDKARKPSPNEMGLYEFDGYSLTLKYDDGGVYHIPTFTIDDKLTRIWYRGRLLSHK